jgi:hypothetical protein
MCNKYKIKAINIPSNKLKLSKAFPYGFPNTLSKTATGKRTHFELSLSPSSMKVVWIL